MPEKENAYGVYGNESGQLPPSTSTTTTNLLPNSKYLPKNYNPVAYVTAPEDALMKPIPIISTIIVITLMAITTTEVNNSIKPSLKGEGREYYYNNKDQL
ncbi:hypothetical protein CQW23_23575 [Capsicum baccatum]|uniref:Uncharacterized protein n=1 Tax=Capsicum baccatum TaxID=33114 RepID=A0A2G2VSD1_CAPBA|nr:hypothetical protein CQW23_23575 [Capsicum baccatum]